MGTIVFFSYLSSTLAYSLLLLRSLLRKQHHTAFIMAVFFSLVWSFSVVWSTQSQHFFLADTLVFETIRNTFWLILSATLLTRQQPHKLRRQLTHSRQLYLVGLFTIFLMSIETFPHLLDSVRTLTDQDPRFIGHVIFAILGLILIEQLYRNTPLPQRWNLKFICLALGSTFAYDLIVYSKSLLYQHLDLPLWQARGFVNALTTPFFAVSLTRLDNMSSATQTTPRKVVFYSTVLFGSGLYLILMAGAGYYLKQTNAEWGDTLQTLFIALALLLLVITLTSGKIRALAKVYFSKHFFHYSYDYREEWLKISKALARLESLEELQAFIITTLTNLVESTGGGLWLKNDQGDFCLVAEQNLRLPTHALRQLKNNPHLPDYLAQKQWVIDFFELTHTPEVYDDIDLSPWCYEDSQVWLIVPLFHLNHLEAFVVLTQPRVARQLNWEDHDLLKTVGMQLANAIALTKASEALASSRQFEAYHRLSAFLVHDLKNITAQIALIVKNAEKHRHNPEFFDDTLETLDNVVGKMHRIVDQLKQGTLPNAPATRIDLKALVQKIQRQHMGAPSLQLELPEENCIIQGDVTKLNTILTNLIQNAQDASRHKADGWVKLALSLESGAAIIKIIDNGIGMDAKFIAERLFKPFDTTKGNAGMGIGAYEARDYILKNNGLLDVESQPDHGTTLTLRLPLTP